MLRKDQAPTLQALQEIVYQRNVPHHHGARRYLTFIGQGPHKARGFVDAIATPFFPANITDGRAVDEWLRAMDQLFNSLQSNMTATDAIAHVTRQCVFHGCEAVAENASHINSEVRTEVAAVLTRMPRKDVKKRTGTSGMSGNISGATP